MPPPDAAPYSPPDLTLTDLKRVHPLWLAQREAWITTREVTTNALQDRRVMSKYLPKGQREYDADYAARVAMTEFVPESTVARSRIVGALYGQQVSRQLEGELADWAGDVDGLGHGLDDLGETQIVPVALDYGAAHILVDFPSDGGSQPQTRAEQIARGIDSPRLCVYTPLEVRNWTVGPDGALDWVLIVEDGTASDERGRRRVPERTYRWFDRQGFAVWRVRTKEGKPFPPDRWDAEGNPSSDPNDRKDAEEFIVGEPLVGRHASAGDMNGRGRVPMTSFIPERVTELIGRATIQNALRLDLRRLLLESDMAWDLFNHAHPIAVLKSTDQKAEVGIGATSCIKLNPGKEEDFFYAELGTESFGARERALDRASVDIHRHMGMDPLGVIGEEAQAASGVARAYSFTTSEARHIGRLASRMQDVELELLRIVASWIGAPEVSGDAVRWPESFDVTSIDKSVEVAISFPYAVASPTAVRMLQKRLARRQLGEVSPDDQRQIDAEIDAADVGPRAPAATTPDGPPA